LGQSGLRDAQAAEQSNAEEFLVHVQLLDQGKETGKAWFVIRRPSARHPVQHMTGRVKAMLTLP
jgi:hypothetical protein